MIHNIWPHSQQNEWEYFIQFSFYFTVFEDISKSSWGLLLPRPGLRNHACSAQETLWGNGDQLRFGSIQGKCPTCSTISLSKCRKGYKNLDKSKDMVFTGNAGVF